MSLETWATHRMLKSRVMVLTAQMTVILLIDLVLVARRRPLLNPPPPIGHEVSKRSKAPPETHARRLMSSPDADQGGADCRLSETVPLDSSTLPEVPDDLRAPQGPPPPIGHHASVRCREAGEREASQPS